MRPSPARARPLKQMSISFGVEFSASDFSHRKNCTLYPHPLCIRAWAAMEWGRGSGGGGGELRSFQSSASRQHKQNRTLKLHNRPSITHQHRLELREGSFGFCLACFTHHRAASAAILFLAFLPTDMSHTGRGCIYVYNCYQDVSCGLAAAPSH